MILSPNTQTILLLTARFGNYDYSSTNKPLTPKEYGRFAEWLKLQSITPEQLLSAHLQKLLLEWQDKTVTVQRIESLLNRGAALALSMEKWLRSGLWVMTRSDDDYPKRLKHHLRSDSPAVLFGCGNRYLLNSGGLAVIGSRQVSQDDLIYSSKIGELASNAGVSIVSGGAKGVDESAMLGALGAEGTAVGVLANNLLRASISGKYRRALMENNLVLVSPFNPEAGFNAGNAMARNKYIYCLADTALAVHSGIGGGTWSGAQENLRKGWVPLWVRYANDPEAGNSKLISAGASKAPASIDEVNVEVFLRITEQSSKIAHDIFSTSSIDDEDNLPAKAVEKVVESQTNESTLKEEIKSIDRKNGTDTNATVKASIYNPVDLFQISFYSLFVSKVTLLCADHPRSANELVEEFSLSKTQLNVWLKRAVADGYLKKLYKPVRYDTGGVRQGSLGLE